MAYFYHVTPKSRLASIKRQGILPNCKPIWKNMFGEVQRAKNKIYLCDDFWMAVR